MRCYMILMFMNKPFIKIQNNYNFLLSQGPYVGLLLWLGLGVMITGVFSLTIGTARLPFITTLYQLWNQQLSQAVLILWEIRLPRMLMGILVGATLGLAGAAMQGLLRNPLASPGILGISGGASFGAVLILSLGLSNAFTMALPLGGMAGAFLSVVLIYLFAGARGSLQTLILAGVAVNSLFVAGTALVLNLSANPYAALEIVFWQMGSLANRSLDHVWMTLPMMMLGWIMIFWDARALSALTLGEETASSLGFNLQWVRARLVLGTTLSVGAAVSVTGSIGFIGLVVPHLVRPLVKGDPGKLLAVSAFAGAILLLGADIAVRLLSHETELKIGVLTSIIGAPFFLLLLYKMRREIS